MEIFLFIIILLQFVFLVYLDIQNRAERENFLLKLMSKDLSDYKSAMEEAPQETKREEEDPYVTIEEAGIETILKAEEK